MRRLPSVLLIAAFLVGGCQTIPKYAVSIRNVGKETVDSSSLKYDEFVFSAGVLPPGVWKYHGVVQFPVPETVTVEWRTVDGSRHRKEVDLRSVKKDFAGEIWFEIDDGNNVTLRTIPEQKRVPEKARPGVWSR